MENTHGVISKIIKYASSLVPGITDKFNDIDEAIRLGFNWTRTIRNVKRDRS